MREELINTTLTGLEATIASLEQLGTVARDKEGFALATRTLAGIPTSGRGRLPWQYGKYDETARYFRRMEELGEQLAAADPDGLEPIKVNASVKATLGDFQMNRVGDTEAAIKYYDQALLLRRQWLEREPTNDETKQAVANMLGAIGRARLVLGVPAKARDCYREEVALRDQLSPAFANRLETRRERPELRDKLGDLSVSLGDPATGLEYYQQRNSSSAGRSPRQNPEENARSIATCSAR